MVQIETAMRRTMTATTITSSSLTSATATRTKAAAATKRIVVRSAMTQLKYRRRRRLACLSCPLANFPSARTVRRAAAAAAAVSIGRNWTTRRRKRWTGPPDLSAPCLAVEAPAWAANVGPRRCEDFHFWNSWLGNLKRYRHVCNKFSTRYRYIHIPATVLQIGRNMCCSYLSRLSIAPSLLTGTTGIPYYHEAVYLYLDLNISRRGRTLWSRTSLLLHTVQLEAYLRLPMGVTVFKVFSNWFKDVRRERGMEAQLNEGESI